MPLKFTSKKARDELAERLVAFAKSMLRAGDQGHDGMIRASDEMIGDIQTAACVVALSEIQEPPNDDATKTQVST